MKELDFIDIIKNQTDNVYIGDDCAYLKDFGITVSQDNFIEDVHFKREWASPYDIGYKAAAVNISDILASGAKPEFISLGLSLPDVDSEFIKEFCRGVTDGSYGAKIIGGDITGADKIFISITAIGSTSERKISSRSHARPGYVVITKGEYGLSSQGLNELSRGIKSSKAIDAHLRPKLDLKFSEAIAENIHDNYAMMDTSDGLADALFKIAKSSGCTIKSKYIDGMFGAEDYHLVAAVPENFLRRLKNFYIVARVCEFTGAYLEIEDKKYKSYDELNLYNHFGE